MSKFKGSAQLGSFGAATKYPRRMRAGRPPSLRREQGITLIELLVSIAIGLLTIAVAIGALMVSRGVSGTVSDVSQLQQQAAYAFRVIGQQVRQAGSMELNLAAQKVAGAPIDPEDKVAFMLSGYSSNADVVSGMDAPSPTQFKLSVGHRNYLESNVAGLTTTTLFRDCLGQGGAVANPLVTSRFVLDGSELKCSGSGLGAQAIIQNVTNLEVNYLVQQPGLGAPTVLRTNAAGVSNWKDVYAVEVCLELLGDERVDIPAASTYTNCAGTATSYGGRLRMVFRNTFQIRSQGLLS